jgi:hypothetical protein
MGEIEAVKVGSSWRVAPEAVVEYAKRLPEIKNRKPSGYFVYPGDGGFLFGVIPDRLPPDPRGQASCVERRRRKLVRGKKRSSEVLLQKLKSLGQLELFAG